MDTWLRQEGRERKRGAYRSSLPASSARSVRSDLIGVIPERLIRAYAGTLDLDAIKVPLDVGTFDEYLLHPARSRDDPGCVWLRGILMEIAKFLGPLEPKHRSRAPL